jgi:hypothetical protein
MPAAVRSRAAVDTREEAVDASPDVDGIVHDLPEMMTPHRCRGARVAREIGAEKAGKGRRDDFGLSGAARTLAPTPTLCRPFLDGETRTRTGDTTIFRRGNQTLERPGDAWDFAGSGSRGSESDVSQSVWM